MLQVFLRYPIHPNFKYCNNENETESECSPMDKLTDLRWRGRETSSYNNAQY